MSIKKGNYIYVLILLLSVLCFIIMVSGSAQFWYKQGAGHALGELIDSGLEIDFAIPKAKISGFIYATLMVLGLHFSILTLFLVSVGILMRTTFNKNTRKILKLVFPIICLLGTICLGLGQNMVQYNARWEYYIGAALLIWLAIGTLFIIGITIVIGIQQLIKKLTEKEPK